jgi:hypothetical protein
MPNINYKNHRATGILIHKTFSLLHHLVLLGRQLPYHVLRGATVSKLELVLQLFAKRVEI